MASHLFDLAWIERMGSHCYHFVTVLVLTIRSNCYGRFACWPIESNAIIVGNSRFYISVALNKVRVELALR